MQRCMQWMRIPAIAIAVAAFALSSCASAVGPNLPKAEGEAAIKPILQRQVDRFTTGLNPVEGLFWVDNNRVLMGALEEGLHQEYPDHHGEKRRLVLIDYEKRQTTTLLHGVRLLDLDRKTGVLWLDVIHPEDEDNHGACAPSMYCADIREFQLAADGTVSEVARWPRGKKLDLQAFLPVRTRAMWLNGGRDGFLVKGFEPGSDPSTIPTQYKALRERLSRYDEGLPTMWLRKGRSPQAIAVRFDELNGRGIYLDFIDRYLLVDTDTSGNSATNAYMAVHPWKRPYKLSPFYLLAPDGSIETISYPDFIFDYGIGDRHPHGSHGRNFGYLLPSRAGILISTTRDDDSALYLYSQNQLYQLAGHSRHFRMKPRGAVGFFALSPDGCKLAYEHTNFDALDGPPRMGHYVSPVLTIINVCGGT